MPKAIDTILAVATNPGAGGAAASTTASGDPTIVRAFQSPAQAFLDNITRMGATLGFAQVVSPTLHDPVTGLRITPGETPSVFALPGAEGQELTSGDQLSLSISGGAAESDVMALHTYYTDTGGVDASLFLPGDIDGNIDNIKTQRVAVTSSATIGAWSDTLVGTTENLLVANRDYAVLGYLTNTALAVIGIRGNNTGNLRACGPGSTSEFPTSQYFRYMAEKTGRPYIPVFNQQNVGNTFVSVAAATASVAAVVTLILAELKSRITR
jgi:hypothetical protein